MKWRILIVDDEPDVRMIIRTTLEPKYEVIEAQDGLDALEKVERASPDFVIMDIMMPLMNGHEACQAIRKNPRFHDLPVMFLSALGSRDDIKKGFNQGANMYLTKPFDPPRLLKNVDVFFEQTPPEPRKKRYTIEQLQEAESSGTEPAAPGSSDFQKRPSSTTKETAPRPSQTSTPAAGAAESTDEAAAGFPRVMAVDDDPEIIDLMRVSLDGVAELVSASDGIDAIEKLVKYQPDILVIDIMLPKMNGFQLCQSLRGNRAFQRLPILMCSAKSQERDKVFAKRLGANDYLTKPFSPAQLIEKIREMQKLPGFRIRPKTLPIEQIQHIDAPEEAEDVFQAEEDARQRKKGATDRGGEEALDKFLAQEGKKEALDKQEQQGEESKKRRRFFGFGGKH